MTRRHCRCPPRAAAPLDVRLALSAVAGFLTAVGDVAAVRLQSYGYVPAQVAAAA